MKTYDSITSLTFFRQVLLLPCDKNHKSTGYVLYALNMSQDSIANLFNNTNRILSNTGNIYKSYYYDYKYLKNCIKSPNIKSKMTSDAAAKKKRLVDYDTMKNKSDIVKTPLSLNAASNRNIIYDLAPIMNFYNTNPKVSKMFIRKKLRTFFDTISAVYNTKLQGSDTEYTKSFIMVDLDEYDSYKNTNNIMSHVLNNLILLMKRGDKFTADFNYNMKFLFFTKNGYFLFDMGTDLKKTNLSKLKLLTKKLKPSLALDTNVTKVEQEEVARKLSMAANNPQKSNLVGDEEPDEIDEDEPTTNDDRIDTVDTLVDKVMNKVDDPSDLDDKTKMDEVKDEIFNDEELKKEYMDALTTKKTHSKSDKSLKRDAELREKQKKIVVKTKTIEELANMTDIPEIPKETVEQVPEVYTNIRNVQFPNFQKNYMDTMYEKHVSEMVTCLNDKSLPVTVVDIKVEDTSDALNMKETYTVILEDENRKRHTLKFNMPIFIDDRFIYINGNKKTIQKQFFAYPVVKTGPAEVQVVTNYNKIFIRRMGSKLSVDSEKLRKLLADDTYSKAISYTRGCNTGINKNYLTCLEYDELAAQYNVIKIGKANFVFNAEKMDELFNGKEKSTLDKYIVGYEGVGSNRKPIYYEPKAANATDLYSFMVSFGSEVMQDSFKSYTTGKKYMYTSATIMRKKIPTVILLCLYEGLDTVVRKFNDSSVSFSDKKDKGSNYMYIKFADGFLCYPQSNIEACIFFNGFSQVTTTNYTIQEMNERGTYIDIFEELYGSADVSRKMLNYYDFMIDPITYNVLELLNYPTDIVSLMIFANNMLADNAYVTDIDLHMYRLRENEVVPAILYKNIAASYFRYSQTANNPNPVKISMDPDAVIKELLELPTVEDYSTLSPMVELHKDSIVSMKGASGLNTDRAYKADKRAFDDSMIGICGISTDAGPNCGKIRQLVAEPKVTNALGFMDLTDMKDVDKLSDVNLSVPIEMLTPGTNNHDNPSRNSMASKQTCHVIPVEKNCPVLVSTGMDLSAHYRTGNDFSVVAKQNGKVIEYDESAQMMIVQYKDGTKQAVDLSPHSVKNGGGGFYLMNQLHTDLGKGSTFKKNDILAYDPKYYRDEGVIGNRMTMGSLMKVAAVSGFFSFQDSTFVTKKMSRDMGTNITMKKYAILGPNSNVGHMVKIGDHVDIGDELISYESSYDDEELNKLLYNVRDDMKEDIINLGKSRVTSHYSGEVSDILVYSTSELDELSPSLRKLVKTYQDTAKRRQNVIKQNLDDPKKFNPNAAYQMGILMDKPTGTVKPDQYGKIKGFDVSSGVLIEFYVTYHDELSDGDKVTQFTANKSTIGYVVKEGFEPYSEFRPYEEISSCTAPSAILQRNTPSVILTGCTYKVLIELARKQYEILTGENYDEILKQKNPWLSTNRKVTKESINVISDKEISILESVFDLSKDSEGKYTSIKAFNEDDIITTIHEDYDLSKFIDNFRLSNESYNAIMDFDTNTIRAMSFIRPNEPIVIGIE